MTVVHYSRKEVTRETPRAKFFETEIHAHYSNGLSRLIAKFPDSSNREEDVAMILNHLNGAL